MQKHSTTKNLPQPTAIALAVASSLGLTQQPLHAATCNANNDATLRACITNSAVGDTIAIQADITLNSFLPDVTKNLTFQGNNHRLSGNNAQRVLWVESGTVVLSNLTIANGKANGGNGGDFGQGGGGGGGAGLGGGLFINGGNVSLQNVNFTQNVAKGGNGFDNKVSQAIAGNGGGGLGGNGGIASGNIGGGGGGRLPGENGSDNGVGGGTGGTDNSIGGFGGGGGGGDEAAGGGRGGFGGGGAGGGNGGYSSNAGSGGYGGFGGGGGGGGGADCDPWDCYLPGLGATTTGFGGGGEDGTTSGYFGSGGSGGGGFGAGGAIFAKAGTLALTNVAFTQNSTLGGIGYADGQSKAGAIFICTSTEDETCTANVTASSCGVTFTGNTAVDAGTTDMDNADTFKVNRTNLMRSCTTPPVAVTQAPSVITATSARLSGTVNPKGLATNATFDFGPTTSYGTNITATPATIAATAATTNVSADKAGLTCATTYHYRVKAVNSAGTSLGLDKAFATSTCLSDLLVTNVLLTPTIPVAGAAFTAAVTVKNQGTMAAGVSKLAMWSNQATTQICNAVANKTVNVAALAAGASATVTVTGLVSNVVGVNTLRAFVDSACVVVESDETNNQRTLSYRIKGRSPDFVITNITLTPAAPTVNTVITAAITVKNQGTATGNAGFLDVWANQATVPTCGTVGNAWNDIGALEVGASKTISFPLASGSAGSKTLRAFIDSWCETTEANELNNQLTKVYVVQ